MKRRRGTPIGRARERAFAPGTAASTALAAAGPPCKTLLELHRATVSLAMGCAHMREPSHAATPTPPTRDPVCAMTVDRDHPKGGQLDHADHTYRFCSARCREKFAAAPGKYLAPAAPQPSAPAPAGARYVCPMHPEVESDHPGPCPKCGMALEPATVEAPARVEYTCPMHPEIVRDAPGSCPICGMALEPRTVSDGAEKNEELEDMTRRFKIGLLLTIPLLLLAMSDLIPGQPLQHAVSMRLLTLVQLTLATPVVLWGGWPFFQRGWLSIVNRSLNMFTLIAIGTGVAYSYSVVATFLPNIFPASVRGHGGEVGVYFEVSAAIVVLVLLGQVLELRARSQTSSAIKAPAPAGSKASMTI